MKEQAFSLDQYRFHACHGFLWFYVQIINLLYILCASDISTGHFIVQFSIHLRQPSDPCVIWNSRGRHRGGVHAEANYEIHEFERNGLQYGFYSFSWNGVQASRGVVPVSHQQPIAHRLRLRERCGELDGGDRERKRCSGHERVLPVAQLANRGLRLEMQVGGEEEKKGSICKGAVCFSRSISRHGGQIFVSVDVASAGVQVARSLGRFGLGSKGYGFSRPLSFPPRIHCDFLLQGTQSIKGWCIT